jgi:hypothetical protein
LVFDYLIIKTTNNFELQPSTSEAIQLSTERSDSTFNRAKRFNFQQSEAIQPSTVRKCSLKKYKFMFTVNQNQQPTTNNQQPTTNNQKPTTNNQQPTTNNQNQNQQPTTNNPLILSTERSDSSANFS